MPNFFKLTITIILTTTLILSQQVLAHTWIPVRGGIPFGISGIALIKQQNKKLNFLVIHDNKKKNQGRLGILTIEGQQPPQYLPLKWDKNIDLPLDLEAITTIPTANNQEFIALTSAGTAYHLKFNSQNQTISVIKLFILPEVLPDNNIESFSLQTIKNQLVAVWAHRGEDEQPAILYWGIFDLTTYHIKVAGTAKFQVPYPQTNVRHISDLKIDDAGIVYITSASDTGNDGPFQSAVYVAGYLAFHNQKIVWQQNQQLFPIYRDNYHKIEGLEIIPGASGGIIVATDDENMGASVHMIGQ
ncbi:hypothetical protein B6N60_01890 [Richelia sinica FACHB-800]|uniref:Uncharacterized protein n=1 Tax=Richelia sinica FACHB-800 TaxID=1357546 RepID=A0A975T896_9NOST|nr:hypothetical protein [Richelia sinica]MBD2664698.1 hypothetical protein [Richelia sinica FACHB-800]QXE23201.1 hypothetical protein B6N60_01890 [Richelia sinica FACHB-800]